MEAARAARNAGGPGIAAAEQALADGVRATREHRALVHSAGVLPAVFSPGGTRVVTTSNDKTAWLWNAGGSGEPLVLRGHSGGVNSAVFSLDGSRVPTASSDKTRAHLEHDLAAPIQRACQYAGRNLADREWAQLMPGQPYRETCPEWP